MHFWEQNFDSKIIFDVVFFPQFRVYETEISKKNFVVPNGIPQFKLLTRKQKLTQIECLKQFIGNILD